MSEISHSGPVATSLDAGSVIESGNSEMAAIQDPYLLSVCVPVKIDSDGTRWCDELWAKDLALHAIYIKNLTIACPRMFAEPSCNDVPLNTVPFNQLKFVDLPNPRSHLEAIAVLPELVSKMWAAVREATIVHTGFGGWPISEGWLAVPMAKLQGKFVITLVESSFWRSTSPNTKWYNKLRAIFIEQLNGLCINIANLRFFTSRAYARDFLRSNAPRAYVAQASWIDDVMILSEARAVEEWSKKSHEVRLLFAGRLTKEKGVEVLLDAIRAAGSPNLSIAFIGAGPLQVACDSFARTTGGQVTLLEPVQYGPEFYKLLRGYDAVIVPSISDEQPRIIFDAFSQAVPVLGADTGGIREVVEAESNGRLYPPGDANALADVLLWAAKSRSILRLMGLSALSKAKRFTHRSMHVERSNIIFKELRHFQHPNAASSSQRDSRLS
jgi:glycosyltransferase involved in cell wall biosynthesis